MWLPSDIVRLTPIQKAALRHTLAGHHTLILAPAGSGKTLAAFLALLNRLRDNPPPPNRVCAVYVSPLKALGNDIRRNLAAPLAELNAALPPSRAIRMEIRTGDTLPAARARLQRRPPHILITTPESLSSLLSQRGWAETLRPGTVIVDEIHALAESKRGALLALSLERLEERSPHLQRIGLSATAQPVEAVARLLAGRRPVRIASASPARSFRLDIACPPNDVPLPPAGYSPNRIAPLAASLVAQSPCTLLFTSTRSAAEQLGIALRFLLPEFEDHIAVHHGSIHRDARFDVEQRLKDGALRAAVSSTSLELGVDFSVHQVLLAGTPRGVSRALQRLGRAGRRPGVPARGVLLPLSLPDLLESIALADAVRRARLDSIRTPQAPLDVLAQTLLGMAVERPWPLDDAFRLVRRAGPFLRLSRADFDAVLDYLAGAGRVLSSSSSPRYGKITIENGLFRVASPAVARSYYANIGAISAALNVRVFLNRRPLGEVEEGFLSSLLPGEGFILGGKAVRLKALQGASALVEPARLERLKTPRWMGGRMSLTARLAAEQLRLRQDLRDAFLHGGVAEVRRVLLRRWRVPAPAARRAALYVERQFRACPVPVHSPVTLERLSSGPSLILLFHSLAGRDANRALAWVLSWRFARSHPHRPSAVANFDDHAFLLSLDARLAPSLDTLRSWFNPNRFLSDLHDALHASDALSRAFRPVAETGQLLPRPASPSARSASWSAPLLFSTLRRYEPSHPLLRETLRETLEDQLDAPRARAQAAHLFEAPWDVFDLPRPSPFALPLFAAFHREVILTQDPDRALEDFATRAYDDWNR